jgi:predicted dehydrogenase
MTVPRLAVVGINGHGRGHVEQALRLEARGLLRLVAVADPQAPPAGLLPGHVAVFASLSAALEADTLDIVVLCTPIHTHFELAALALRAGADVVLEKPPTATLAEFSELSRLAGALGRSVQVGFQSLGSGGIPWVRDAVARGDIGPAVGIGASGTWIRSVDYWNRAAWSGRRTLGGVAVVDGVTTNPLAHAVATALAIAGATGAADIESVETDLYRANDIEVDDTSSILVTTATGTALAFGLVTTARVTSEPSVTVYGTTGRIVFFYTLDVSQVFTDGNEQPVTTRHERRDLLTDLLDHRRCGTPLAAPLAATGAFMRVLEAVRTAPDPTLIPSAQIDWVDDELGRHAVVRDVEHWVARVGAERKTFAELGAPWTVR